MSHQWVLMWVGLRGEEEEEKKKTRVNSDSFTPVNALNVAQFAGDVCSLFKVNIQASSRSSARSQS